jgi:hypothetical protein
MDQPLIGPEPVYPTPWKVDGQHPSRPGELLVATSRDYPAFSADPQLAELIVGVMNWFAGSGLTLRDLENSQSQANGVWIRKKVS